MFIGHLAVAAVAEFEEGLNGIAAGVAGVSGEKQFEAAVRLIHQEIGVPVGAADGFADQTLGTLHLFLTIGSPLPPPEAESCRPHWLVAASAAGQGRGRTAIDRIKPPMDWV